MKHPTSHIPHPTSSWLRVVPGTAAVNAPQSRRFAKCGEVRPSRSVWIAVALAPLFALLLALNTSLAADTNTVFLFSFFREPNGQAGLFLADSTNGLNWTELKAPNGKSFLEPQVGGKLMRDPCLRRGPDGVFHLVWTTSWGRPPVFGYARSTDLIHWSEEKAIPVMEKDPTAQNVWAPELFYDEVKAQWLVFWATTIPGKFPETANSGDNNHRIYYVTTKDFTNFSPTKLLYDGGFNVIDATMLADGGKYYLDRQRRDEESGEEKSPYRGGRCRGRTVRSGQRADFHQLGGRPDGHKNRRRVLHLF